MCYLQIFDKIHSFLNKFQMSLTAIRVDYVFEEPLKKLFNLISRLRWETQYPWYTEYIYYFLIKNWSNARDFWTEDKFCFISDCWNSCNCKIKGSINRQIIVFSSPSNALCSSDKSIQIKYFNHHTFIRMCSLFTRFNVKVLNFCY